MTPTLASVGLPVRKLNVELVKKGRGHWYEVEDLAGKRLGIFPGVTGVLSVINKPALIPWATREALKMAEAALMERLGGKDKARVSLTPEWIAEVIAEAKERPDKIKDEAADIGTLAHQAFDQIVLRQEVRLENYPETIREPVKNFLEWFQQSGIRIVMGDTKVASPEDGFGGSLDALGWKDGVGYIILDWKTSSGIWPEYALQVAAYAHAFEITFGVPISEAIIVRFDKKKPVWEHKKVSNLTVSYGAFKAAKELKSLMGDYEHFD